MVIVLYVCPSRASVKVPVDWAIPACVKKQGSKYGKDVRFYQFGSVCINVWFELQGFRCVSFEFVFQDLAVSHVWIL